MPVSVADWVAEGQSVTRDFAFLVAYEEIDRTANSAKYCLSIASGLFASVYVNAASGKVSLALIHNSQRVYGRDNQGRFGIFIRSPIPRTTISARRPLARCHCASLWWRSRAFC